MSKGYIVVNKVPANCLGCACAYMSLKGPVCRLTRNYINAVMIRPDWCPVKVVPEEVSEWEMDVAHTESMELGKHIMWNKCLNELFGEGIEDE